MHATRASHTLGCRVEGLRLRASGLGLRVLGSELYSSRCGSNQREPQRPAAETAISGTGTREQAHPRRSHRPRSQAGEDCNGTRHANRREMLRSSEYRRPFREVQNLGPWRKHAINKNSIPKNSDPYIDISCAAQSCFEPATLSVLCWTYIVTKLSFQLMEWGFGFVFLPKRSSFPFHLG